MEPGATTSYLYLLLNDLQLPFILFVGIGVGAAAVVGKFSEMRLHITYSQLGTLRFMYGWSMLPLIGAALFPTAILSIIITRIPSLATVVALAWDCGAVTTGPVTVPILLALGIGAAQQARGLKFVFVRENCFIHVSSLMHI